MPRFKHGTHIHRKGYLRVSSGPLRNKYVHRIVAGAMIGRELTKDEECHHRDSDKRNFHWLNLMVLGERDHSWVSNKQAWFMRERDRKEKLEWDKFMREKADEFYREVAEAKSNGVPWMPTRADGTMEAEYDARRIQSRT